MNKWLQDGGHGGTDPGALFNGLVEKTLTLEASLYVQRRLKEHGIDSDVTRTSDTSLSQSQRTSIVRKYKRCISHHFNAGGGNGIEVIHSIKADGKFENALIQDFRNAGYPIRRTPVFTKQQSDGRDWYFMHRETGACRVTIIEYDFVDGPNAEKLKDKAYREGMYELVVMAICREEGVSYKPLNVTAAQPEKEEKVVSNTPSATHKEAWEKATKLGLFNGQNPKGPISREQTATVLMRFMELIQK